MGASLGCGWLPGCWGLVVLAAGIVILIYDPKNPKADPVTLELPPGTGAKLDSRGSSGSGLQSRRTNLQSCIAEQSQLIDSSPASEEIERLLQ